MTLSVDDVLAITPGSGEPVDDWFLQRLERYIDSGVYPNTPTLSTITDTIVDNLSAYKDKHGISDVAIVG